MIRIGLRHHITRPHITRKPGKAAYMGRFQVLEAPNEEKMDPVQDYYLNRILADEIRLKRGDIADNIAMDFKSAGSAISVRNQHEETSEAVKKAGLEHMKKALGASWASRFD